MDNSAWKFIAMLAAAMWALTTSFLIYSQQDYEVAKVNLQSMHTVVDGLNNELAEMQAESNRRMERAIEDGICKVEKKDGN